MRMMMRLRNYLVTHKKRDPRTDAAQNENITLPLHYSKLLSSQFNFDEVRANAILNLTKKTYFESKKILSNSKGTSFESKTILSNTNGTYLECNTILSHSKGTSFELKTILSNKRELRPFRSSISKLRTGLVGSASWGCSLFSSFIVSICLSVR